jgi:hypothetical protein
MHRKRTAPANPSAPTPAPETPVSISLLERRNYQPASEAALKHAINSDQRDALQVLERFGWCLKFVRRDADRRPVAWVYDPDHRRMAVIEPDGTLDESPSARCRH